MLAEHFPPLVTNFTTLADNFLSLATSFQLLVVNFPVLAIHFLLLAERFYALAVNYYSIPSIKTFIFPVVLIKAIMALSVNSTFSNSKSFIVPLTKTPFIGE